MFGVVLWSDPEQHRAVIWCEDHGDLAFWNAEEAIIGALSLEPGDLVRFELNEEGSIRRAINPVVVASDEYPTLAGDLRSAEGRVADNAPALPVGQNVQVDQKADQKIVTFEPPAGGVGDTAKPGRRTAATRRRQGMSGTG